jgi:hypothetical protein
MPEVKNYTFDHAELAEILLKKLDIHEGIWGIYLEFSLVGGMVPMGPDGKVVLPAAINYVTKIGIQRFETPNGLTVDAARVNPIVPSHTPGKRH